jgi:hypothetical protein
MRRVRYVPSAVSTFAVVFFAPLISLLGVGVPAIAAPSGSPSAAASGAAAVVPSAVAGQPVCVINAKGVNGLSGIVATSTGFVAVNDSQVTKSEMKIFNFNAACKLTSEVPYPSDAFDPEDLGQAKDGTLWVADTGDNPPTAGGSGKRRETVALWSLAPGANQKPVIHRFVYPDPPHDAEALLISPDGTPLIITKQDEPGKTGTLAGIYAPAAAIQNANTTGVPLKRVGDVKLPTTETANPLSILGRNLITGGATSPDRKKVVLRTYSDAFEWDVPDGDVVKAITTGTPRITPLPDEPFGEGISYTTDGKSFWTLTDNENSATKTVTVLRYTPTAPASATTPPAAKKDAKSGKSWMSSLTIQDLTYAVAALGAIGLALVVAGMLGIRRSRQSRATEKVKGAAAKPVVDEWADFDQEFGAEGGPPAATAGGPDRKPPSEPAGGAQRPGGTVYGRGPAPGVDRAVDPGRAAPPDPRRGAPDWERGGGGRERRGSAARERRAASRECGGQGREPGGQGRVPGGQGRESGGQGREPGQAREYGGHGRESGGQSREPGGPWDDQPVNYAGGRRPADDGYEEDPRSRGRR